MNARFSNSAHPVRTNCGVEYGFDHLLEVGTLKIKLKKIEEKREKQTGFFDIQKLEDPKICEDFRKNIINTIKEKHINYENVYCQI